MKAFNAIYHFLGSVYFALILIALVTFFVVVGTVLESSAQSHLYAAQFTYGHPIFALLLWGFFINILFAATRRWPFKVKHIPFLTTHLGLLMILAGVIVKHYFGVQGTLHLIEGSGSHDLQQANSFAVSIQHHGESVPSKHVINTDHLGGYDSMIAKRDDGLTLRLIEFNANSSEKLNSWIKGSFATISGLKPLPMATFAPDSKAITPITRVRFHENSQDIWNVYAMDTVVLSSVISELYGSSSTIKFTNRLSGKTLASFALKDLLKENQLLNDGTTVKGELVIPVNELSEIENPALLMSLGGRQACSIPLKGPSALSNINRISPYLGKLPIACDIITEPLLAFIRDAFGDIHIVAIDSTGQLWVKQNKEGHFDTLLAYDGGYGGYATKIDIPFDCFNISRTNREQADAYALFSEIQKAEEHGIELPYPLQIFRTACNRQNVPFAEAITTFLTTWDDSNAWLYPKSLVLNNNLSKVFADSSWNEVPIELKRGCLWNDTFFSTIAKDLQSSKSPYDILLEAQWPLLDLLSYQDPQDALALLTDVTHQIFSAAAKHALEEDAEISNPTPEMQAAHFSALLRAYNIHMSTLTEEKDPSQPLPSQNDMALANADKILAFTHIDIPIALAPVTLETQITPSHEAISLIKKIEENTPRIVIHAVKGRVAKSISLRYDRSGRGMRWPIMNGEYLARFEPNTITLPYHLRLRQARQINYPNSKQAFSYESDLIIIDRRTDHEVETTISMNKVHETWDGYRFYLSTIAHGNGKSAKQIQVVVNRDPAKYWLTYPGAIILSCGIIMLFVMRPYRKRDSR